MVHRVKKFLAPFSVVVGGKYQPTDRGRGEEVMPDRLRERERRREVGRPPTNVFFFREKIFFWPKKRQIFSLSKKKGKTELVK